MHEKWGGQPNFEELKKFITSYFLTVIFTSLVLVIDAALLQVASHSPSIGTKDDEMTPPYKLYNLASKYNTLTVNLIICAIHFCDPNLSFRGVGRWVL